MSVEDPSLTQIKDDGNDSIEVVARSLIGKKFGDYTVQQPLGEGAFAEVYIVDPIVKTTISQN